MLFIERLQEERVNIRPALDNLFHAASANQVHPQDLFLVINQGYYDEALENNTLGLSKYVIGLPGIPGLEYNTAYDFIDAYRQNVLIRRDEYEQYLQEKSATREGKDEIEKGQLISIQLEQLIYLKFWESNFIIRIFYQLTRLANGEGYDWDFTLKQKSRSNILRDKIIGKLDGPLKCFANVLEQTYKPQIRNLIAHSMFFHIGDFLQFTNHNHNPDDDLQVMSFKEWEGYIHKTLTLFDELIRQRKLIQTFYASQALKDSNHRIEYRLKTRSNDEVRTIKFFPEINRWGEVE